MIQVTIGSASHKGLKKKENQDYHAFFSPEDGRANNKGILMAIADGMGGRTGGSTASRTTIDILMEEYYKDMSTDIPESLRQAILKANDAVIAKGKAVEELDGMASTLVAVVLKNDKMYHANVGDSRGYLIDENQISQFTEDHSFVASLVKAGAISEEDALNHPESHVITRAVGLGPELQVDTSQTHIKVKKGQYFLLCCDGLWGVVPDDKIVNTVYKYREPDVVCQKLVEKANENGGPDNITVIVARIDKTDLMSSILDKCINLVR
ncbi:Stp1/IreP family PP2C-type Ser/Thr phosphatase [Thermodesulfobacteriota bacterium]